MPKKKQTKLKQNLLPAVTPVEWFDERFYKRVLKIGQPPLGYPSVTTILGTMIDSWLLRHYGELGYREARRKLEERGDFGSRVHHAIYTYVNGGVVLYQPPWNKTQIWSQENIGEIIAHYNGNVAILQDQREMVQVWSFQKWFDCLKPQVAGSEVVVYSDIHHYAGTTDHLFHFSGKSVRGGIAYPAGDWVYDGKSGAKDKKHHFQVAAYAKAVEEMGICKPVGAMVHYWQDDTVVFIMGDDLKRCFDSFLKIKAVFDIQNPNITPEMFEFPSALSQTPIPKVKK